MPIRPKRAPIAALTDVAFDEAIRYAEQRGLKLPDAYYAEHQGAARAQAFTVSHLASLRQIEAVFDALNGTLAAGGTFEDFSRAVAAGGVELDAAHRETVFRTGVQTAYNAGRRTQQAENEAVRPFLMYDAINDSRTRPAHRAMDGFIAPVGHPIWKRWHPPCGFNCRCSTISLSEAQAKVRGYTGRVREPAVNPDDGWGYDPAERGTAHQRAQQASEQVKSTLPAKVQRASGKWTIHAARKRTS